jgi:Domain of unknown function (DUF4157)/Bacterial SH3 domain
MRTFAQKPKATRQTGPAESAKASPTLSGQRRDVYSILQLQRAIGNQAVQRLLQADAESLEVESSVQGTARFDHDFSRRPSHSGTPRSLQPKLKINAPGDIYEQEADRVAEHLLADPPASTALPLLQRHSEQPPGQDAEAPPSVDRVLASPGAPLQPALQKEMEGHFGYDLSPVRLHHGSDAEESARDVNAKAYTVGHHIVLGTGRYSPETREGKKLLAHELTHVVQQSHAGNLLQRLIRTPYPWRGVILPAIGANMRSAPDSSDPANILDSLPRGETVQVLASSGNWLRVESRHRGSPLVGYILHTLVDDASSSSMAASVGTTMVWRPSGPGSGTNFESWASAATETPFPAVTSTTVMNCWEAVLLAAYRAGAINWTWIHNLYVSTPTADWVATMTRGARRTYAVPGPNPAMPQRGDLVFFNGLAHVALATGNGSDVYTFWPPPNTPFTPGGTTDKVKVFTIEDLVTWWGTNMPPAPTVQFAAPAW